MAKSTSEMTSKELMGLLGEPGSIRSQEVTLEFARRQTEAQILSARWMKWSVAAIAAATIINVAAQIVL